MEQSEKEKNKAAKNRLQKREAQPARRDHHGRGCVVHSHKIERIQIDDPMIDNEVKNINCQKAVTVSFFQRKGIVLAKTEHADHHRDHGQPLQKTDLRKDQRQCSQYRADQKTGQLTPTA